MKKEAAIATVRISEDLFLTDDYRPPSQFYIRDAMGDAVFLKTRNRRAAQQFVDETYGKGKFTVRIVVKAQAR